MAGMEIVVRPVVFPDIRPRAKQSLPPEDDPEKGMAVIQGNPAGSVGMSYTYNVSSSYSRASETERRVDEARIYQKEDDGTINRENFIDIQVANRITFNEGTNLSSNEARPGGSVPGEDEQTRGTGNTITGVERVQFFKRVEEADNIDILERDVIIKNPDAPAGGP